MFQIQPVKSTACETVYRVVEGDNEYMVKLWIITGGAGALAFKRSDRNYGSFDPPCTKRFETTVLWRNAVWDREAGLYDHQLGGGAGDVDGAPTIENALPRRTDDFLEWLEWAMAERVRLIAENAEKNRLEKIGKRAGVAYTTWGTARIPNEPARLLNSGKPYPDSKPNTFRTTGVWLAHSMKGANGKGAVRLDDEITIGIADLRTYCKAIGHDPIDLTIYPAGDNKASTLVVETCPNPASPLHAHRSTFKDGAFDKFQGAHGFTCAVTFSDVAMVALDNKKHRPNKYDPFTLEPVNKPKAKPTTVDVVMVVDNKEVQLPWTGFESGTPGLVVMQKPKYNELLKVEGQDVWEPVRGHWQITHKGSGLLVRDYRLASRIAALRVADNLADTLDWTQTMEQINDDLEPRARRMAVNDAINEQYAAGGATGMPGY